jgi:hypothetical protein
MYSIVEVGDRLVIMRATAALADIQVSHRVFTHETNVDLVDCLLLLNRRICVFVYGISIFIVMLMRR